MLYWVTFLLCIPDWWLGEPHPSSLTTQTYSRNQEFLIFATSQLTLGANQQAGFTSHHQHISAFPGRIYLRDKDHLNQIECKMEKPQGQNQWHPLHSLLVSAGYAGNIATFGQIWLEWNEVTSWLLTWAETASIILEYYHCTGTDEWRKCYVIKCKEMLLHWNKADVAAQFAIKLQVTCYCFSELLLELGSAPAVQ